MKRTHSQFSSILVAGFLAHVVLSAENANELDPPIEKSESSNQQVEGPVKTLAGERFFDGTPRTIQLMISESNIRLIEQDHRPYGRAAIEIDEQTFESVGVKLKGAAGSYQRFDEKPGLTVNLAKYRSKQNFDGIEKFHLNNSVQDESYLCEWLGSEIFRLASYPAPRVSHALVQVNESPKRIYVLRENYNKTLLKRFFADPNGNLYDGGFLQNIDQPLEKDSGEGVDDHSDLMAIVTALQDDDYAKRLALIPKLVDMDRFLTFMAIERMICHWDGYCNNSNNYRVYFDPATKKAIFLPHGMDQIFGETEMGLFDYSPHGMTSFVMTSNEWRRRLRKTMRTLLPLFSPESRIASKLDIVAARLRPCLLQAGYDSSDSFDDRLRELKERFQSRFANLQEQLSNEDEQPSRMAIGTIEKPADWGSHKDHEEMFVDKVTRNGKKLLVLEHQLNCPGYSEWHYSRLLERGTYRFTAKIRCREIKPLEEGLETIVSGNSQSEIWDRFEGSNEWATSMSEVRIVEDQNWITWKWGLRAASGRLEIDLDSIKLQRIQ